MGRTNVVVDDRLVERVKRLYGLRTTRETIDFALRAVAGRRDIRGLRSLRGIGWDGDLEKMRRTRYPVL